MSRRPPAVAALLLAAWLAAGCGDDTPAKSPAALYPIPPGGEQTLADFQAGQPTPDPAGPAPLLVIHCHLAAADRESLAAPATAFAGDCFARGVREWPESTADAPAAPATVEEITAAALAGEPPAAAGFSLILTSRPVLDDAGRPLASWLDPNRPAGVISLAGLRGADDGETLRRLLKETSRLVARGLGLGPGGWGCHLAGDSNPGPIDNRPLPLCPLCQAKICWAAGIRPSDRLEALAARCRGLGLEAEADYYARALARLRPTPAQLTWLAVGFAAQILFFCRFLVQWIASEKRKESVIPLPFWYLSIIGGAMLLTYAIYRQDPVFILGQSTGVLIYARNLIFINRKRRRDREAAAGAKTAVSPGRQGA